MVLQREKERDITFQEDYIREENKSYSNPECKRLQPYFPNFDKAFRLGTRYFYDPEIYKFLECYAESISIYPDSGILGDNRLIAQFKEGNVIASGTAGKTFSFNHSMVIKTSFIDHLIKEGYTGKDLEIEIFTLEQNLMKEFIVGKLLNTLDSPNFMRTFGILKAPKPIDMKGHIKIVGKEEGGERGRIGNYLMLEFIKGKPFIYHLDKFTKDNDFHAIMVCFLQLFYSLWIAFDRFNYIHGDFHDSNILLLQMHSPVNIPYFLPNGDIVVLTTPYVVKIIDYGMSMMDVPVKSKELQRKYGKTHRIYPEGFDTQTQPMGKNLKTPFFDLFKICQKILFRAYKNPQLFQLFTVAFEYIPFLKKYYDDDRNFNKDVLKSKTNLATYGALTKAMALRAEKTLTLDEFHKHLNWVLHDYLKVKYVNLNEPLKLNEQKKLNGQKVNALWITCKPQIIEKLEAKGYKGMHVCRTENEARKELEYHFTSVNTIADYMKRENLTKEQLLKQFPKIEESYDRVIKENHRELNEILAKEMQIVNEWELASVKMSIYKIEVNNISLYLLMLKLRKDEKEIIILRNKTNIVKRRILSL